MIKHPRHAGRAGLLGGILLAASMGSVQAVELSANIGVTSNYLFRGLTQTDDGAAVQGGLDLAHESGLYLGTWASNVDFGGGATGYEIDFWAGFAGEVEQLSYDIGYIYYAYPARDVLDDSDFGEVYLNLGFQYFTAGVYYVTNSQSEVRDTVKDAIYYYGNLDLPLAENFSLGLTLGHQDFRSSSPAEDYTHWQVGLTRATEIGDFTLAYDQNDLSGDDGDPRATVSFVMTF